MLAHILTCDTCRYLFDNYTDLSLLDDIEIDEINHSCEIEFSIDGDFIIPAIYSNAAQPHVAVLSSGRSSSAEFRASAGGTDYILRAFRAGEGTDIDIISDKNDEQYYLVTDEGYKTVLSHNGSARFERLLPGKYAVTKDLKNFIFIDITKNSAF